MAKFKTGDLVTITNNSKFNHGSSKSEISDPEGPKRVLAVRDTYKIPEYSIEVNVTRHGPTQKTSFSMDETELQIYEYAPVGSPTPPFVAAASGPKLGWRSMYNGVMVKDLREADLLSIPNPDTAVEFAQFRTKNFLADAPRRFKIGDRINIHHGVVDLYFGGAAVIRSAGNTGVIKSIMDSAASINTKSAHMIVDFSGVGNFSIFESETSQFHLTERIHSSAAGGKVSEYGSLGSVPTGTISKTEKSQGKIISAKVGASVIVRGTRSPHVVISNNLTIIKDGRRNTGRQVQSTYF